MKLAKHRKTLRRAGSIPPIKNPPRNFRVFISYSHTDVELVRRIAGILKEVGLTPMWDKNFRIGHGFHSEIKRFIAHAHLFLPVITKEADSRNWVQQEIGFAMALNLPILPVVVDEYPGEMLGTLQALRVRTAGLEELRAHLSPGLIATLMSQYARPEHAVFSCAPLPDERAAMIAGHANDVAELGFHALVRQKGALSSFHIPTRIVTNSIWHERYGPEPRSPDHCQKQREERLALGRHAEQSGCRLIINPTLTYANYGPEARLVRLRCLHEFLFSMSDTKCEVAINVGMSHAASVTLVGDWFGAESVSAEVGVGYRQTIFTRHAPTLMRMITAFDEEFDELLATSLVNRARSRQHALKVIEVQIAKLESAIKR